MLWQGSRLYPFDSWSILCVCVVQCCVVCFQVASVLLGVDAREGELFVRCLCVVCFSFLKMQMWSSTRLLLSYHLVHKEIKKLELRIR